MKRIPPKTVLVCCRQFAGERFIVMFDAANAQAAIETVVRWGFDPDIALSLDVARNMADEIEDTARRMTR